jgi:hypothetical protein
MREQVEVGNRLKAERVQEALRAMPEWKQMENGKVIVRVRELPGTAAAEYGAFVLSLAAALHQPVQLELTGKQVVITLRGAPETGINKTTLRLASHLG